MEKIIDNSVIGKRSLQNLSCTWIGSSDFGRIVPVHWEELLGTDKIVSFRPKIEMQMLPLASPTFGKMDIYCHCFFVPTRLLMNGHRDFLNNDGQYKNVEAPFWFESDFWAMYNDATDGEKRGFFKHWTSLGLPPFFALESLADMDDTQPISLLPFRAYNQIYWDYFRDCELYRDDNKSVFLTKSTGHASFGLTSPFAPTMFPRHRNIKDTWIAELFATNGSAPIANINSGLTAGSSPSNPGAARGVYTSNQTSASVQARSIEALTRLAERMSLSGKRSIDLLFARYGIKPEWDKLEMCEYVGGGKQTVLVSDITSTADTTTFEVYNSGLPLGAKAGQGYVALSEVDINYTAKEPGIFMCVCSVMPHVHFVQGISKKWRRQYRDDFFQNHLEHVGQVAVAKGEVGVSYSANGEKHNYDKSKNLETFAFTEPYYEYKTGLDILAGDFMYYHQTPYSNSPDDDARSVQYLQSMEMFVDYPEDRLYSSDNIELKPAPFNKVFFYQGGNQYQNVDDHFHLLVDKYFVLNRPMDGYAVPTIETTEDPHAVKDAIPKSTEL